MAQVASAHLLWKARLSSKWRSKRQKYPCGELSPVLIMAFLIALPLDCTLLKGKNLIQGDFAQ